jgi:two-component system chemotaxis response regulator CheB
LSASGIRVLVVDDSAVVRETIRILLTEQGGFTIDAAGDPIIASGKMARVRPDVILLDLEMPRMDGLTFLRKVMAEDPIPVVICSALTGNGADLGLRALAEGAVAVVTKPVVGVRDFLEEGVAKMAETIREAADARVVLRPSRSGNHLPLGGLRPHPANPSHGEGIIAIGASTGGTEALRFLIQALPADAPGMVIVQHMPEVFTAAFARQLDKMGGIAVKEAEDGDRIVPGRALVAAGNLHLQVERRDGQHFARVVTGPPVSHHRPSVDVLFQSVAEAAGPNSVGVIMTGMGGDGARGLFEMHEAGARTLAQDEASCVVFGMPKEAIAMGAVDEVLPLSELPGAILARAGRKVAGPGH